MGEEVTSNLQGDKTKRRFHNDTAKYVLCKMIEIL